MSVAQVLRQAEALKAAVQDVSRGANEAWISRQNLQDLYQKLLVLDLEYALDKKVEQDLWNHAFKNQINTLQTQAKDKQNPKRPEIVASLNLFLETASGFYLQLLEELCSAFKLDLPCRRRSANIGILKEYGPVAEKIKVPKQSSCLYICQHCLVHLGDIARYREQSEQAQTYYSHAANLVPYNGQPYNQLAILEAAKGNKLSTVVYYIRSIAVKHPFPVACTNLEKLYTKITREIPDHNRKLPMIELVTAHLQFNALVHLCKNLDKAKILSQKILASLPSHITSMSFTSHQLIQMITVNLFTMYHVKKKLTDKSGNLRNKEDGEKKEESGLEEQKGYDMVFNMTISILELLLSVTPKQDVKSKDYHTLPSIKVLLDWIHTDKEIINSPDSKIPSICHNLSKLLNNLQFTHNQKDVTLDLEKYMRVPLPEDCELRCFLPLASAHSELNFQMLPAEGLTGNLEIRIRCQRLIEHGLWLCDEFPSLNLMNVQKQKSGLLYFTSPNTSKPSTGTDPERVTELKSHRQNVAIQAIMQNKSRKENALLPSGESKVENNSNGTPNNSSNQVKGQGSNEGRNTGQEKSSKTEQKTEKPPKKLDAGIMAHSATDTQEPWEKPIPADAWNNPTPPAIVTHMEWVRQPTPTSTAFTKSIRPQAAVQEMAPRPAWPPVVIPRQPPNTFYPNVPLLQQNNKENLQAQYPAKGQGQSQGHIQDGMGQVSEAVMASFSKEGMLGGMFPHGKPNVGVDHLQHEDLQKMSPLQKMQLQQQLAEERDIRDPNPWIAAQQNMQQQRQQQTKLDLLLRQTIAQLDEHIAKIAQQLDQVQHTIVQKHQTMQCDPEIQALRRQLQQLHLQKKSIMDPCQVQRLNTVIAQNEENAIALIHQYQNQINELQLLQQQLHQQLLQLCKQRQQRLAEAERIGPCDENSCDQLTGNKPLSGAQLVGNQLHNSQLPQNMDLSQMMAVLEAAQNDKRPSTPPWCKPGTVEASPPAPPSSVAPMASFLGNLAIGTSSATTASTTSPYWAPKGTTASDAGVYSQFGEMNQNNFAKSVLESLLSGSFGAKSEKSNNGAYIPESDSEDELKQISDGLGLCNNKSGLESLLYSSTFPVSLPLNVDVSLLTEEVPKPDSPPASSLYSGSQSSGASVPSTNTYSLFSQSPWTVQLTSVDTNSHPSSPFGSSEGSVCTTPDPYSSQSEDRASHLTGLGSSLGLGFGFQPTITSSEGWGTPVGAALGKAPGGSTGPPRHVQNLWTSGSSPLQKLLEQQKCHRQNDPH